MEFSSFSYFKLVKQLTFQLLIFLPIMNKNQVSGSSDYTYKEHCTYFQQWVKHSLKMFEV